MKNYYKLLGVDRKASRQEINAAFKKLSLKYHPDRNGGDAYYLELFKEINEAKQVLCDRERRWEYDDDLKKQLMWPSFLRPDEGLVKKEQRKTKTTDYSSSKFNILKWSIAVLGMAIIMMCVLIAIDKATNPVSKTPAFVINGNFKSTSSKVALNDSIIAHHRDTVIAVKKPPKKGVNKKKVSLSTTKKLPVKKTGAVTHLTH
jgi:curved DNA-binding protein CbpA